MRYVPPTTSDPKLEAFCRAIPKAELHCHLLGAIHIDTFRELARREGGMTDEQVDELYQNASGTVRKGAIPGLRALEGHVLRRNHDLYRIAYEYLEDAHAHNVRYSEFFWNPTGVVRGSGLPYKGFQDAIVAAIHDAKRDFGIVARLLPSIDREAPPSAAVERVEWLKDCRCDEVPGIGIDFREALGAPELFETAYALARKMGLKATAHAGEYGLPWTNIQTAIDVLKVDRIDHGYTAVDDADFAKRCAETGIVFTVVPSNSYYLRTLPADRWAELHPVKTMRKLGLKIHPNSDDPMLHNISQTKAWSMMVEDLDFTIADLRDFMLNGLDGAWISETERSQWKAEWAAEFDSLAAQYAAQ
jgi:adenosine deaminase